ncbi:MAG TPA: hypothetical protein HPP77_07440 [Candidatus Hydrogenedentes bacterium]|nr:hypothetical protein [Candidatus Hydrogenedentota bacterium]HIJ73715.1 hypothetical protein [Candidatus Hydrogenedentota bacterium]
MKRMMVALSIVTMFVIAVVLAGCGGEPEEAPEEVALQRSPGGSMMSDPAMQKKILEATRRAKGGAQPGVGTAAKATAEQPAETDRPTVPRAGSAAKKRPRGAPPSGDPATLKALVEAAQKARAEAAAPGEPTVSAPAPPAEAAEPPEEPAAAIEVPTEPEAEEPAEEPAAEKKEAGEEPIVTAKTEDAEVAVAEQKVELPDGFPEDVPVYPGLKLSSVSRKGDTVTLQGATGDKTKDVSDRIGEGLEAEGWKKDMAMPQPGGQAVMMLKYSKNGRTVSLVLTGTSTGTNVVMRVSGG